MDDRRRKKVASRTEKLEYSGLIDQHGIQLGFPFVFRQDFKAQGMDTARHIRKH